MCQDGYEPDGLLVTPAMIDAGVAELREKMFGEKLPKIVEDVFYAMLAAHSLPPQE